LWPPFHFVQRAADIYYGRHRKLRLTKAAGRYGIARHLLNIGDAYETGYKK
jgi:hypothetical protein